MPNHVTNRLIVTGPAIAITTFRQAFLAVSTATDRDGNEQSFIHFDFNRLIPMPEILRRTESSSSVTTGLLVLGRPEIMQGGFGGGSLEAEIAHYLAFPWVKEAGVTDYEGLKALLTKRDPSCIAKAEVAIRAHEECGHASWYSWSIDNWGTKWSSYSFELVEETEELLDFRFDTAWSPPEPVFEVLAGRPECAELEIEIRGFDEGWNFAYRGRISDGCYDAEDVEPSDDFFVDVYGEACRTTDDDEEDVATGPAII